ncbi:MAG: hypothetical protein AAB738_02210 [Patescibacteria group bacterium]
MSSDKALNPATLELTQRIQVLFPRDIDADVLQAWNGTPGEVISTRLRETFGKAPEPAAPPEPQPLLDFVGTTTISATTEPFIAKDRFKQDTSRKAKPKISYLGDNFKAWFLKKTEQPISQTMLRSQRLVKASLDQPIIAELGDEAKSETTLSEIFALISLQSNGENGVLLTNGYANIFYVRDVNGVLRAVRVYWCDDGWLGSAYALDGGRWYGDRRVFSRNS